MSRYPEVRHLFTLHEGPNVAQFDVYFAEDNYTRAFLADVNGELQLAEFNATGKLRALVLEDAKARYRAL